MANDDHDNDEEERSVAARIGILALNLVAPGLGLIRVGALRQGLLFMFAPVIIFAALILVGLLTPVFTFKPYAVFIVVLLSATVIYLISVLVVTWHHSRWRRPLGPWSRWYNLIGILGISAMATNGLTAFYHRCLCKPYRYTSYSMTPALRRDDRLLADMRGAHPPRRGEVIAFFAKGADWIYRVAAIGGDTIEMRDGVPIINGQPPKLQRLGRYKVPVQERGFEEADLSLEQLPGETGQHRILKMTAGGLLDDMPPLRVPVGSVFVLGDDRDWQQIVGPPPR